MSGIDDFMMADGAPEQPAEGKKYTLDAVLPANLDAEKTILGAILLDGNALNDAAERLVSEDFFLDSHRRIFSSMLELTDAGQSIDLVTLTSELARHKEVEAVGGVAYMASLTEGLPRRPVVDGYIKIVKDKSNLRRIMRVCSAAIARASDQSESSMQVLEAAEEQLLEIAQEASTNALRTVADSVVSAGGVREYMEPIVNPQVKPGLLTGFSDYDAMTGGLQKQELTILAARPAMGKSALGINILVNVCFESDLVAAFFSVEMGRTSIERRVLASDARVDVRRAMSGEYLSEMEREKLGRSLERFIESKLYIDDTGSITPTQMRAKARRLKQREGRLDLVLVDYLQLMMASQRGGNRQEEVASISRSLKAMAKELDCPVVALAQLSRSNEQRQDKRPMLSDLRESGQIEQDADVVAFLHRDSYYDPQNEELRGIADLIIAKQRSGPTSTVKLAYQAELTRFDNLARR